MRQFYLHARKGIFYVQFVNQETKKCLPARSTGKGNRDEALIVVAGWLKDGIPERHPALAPKPSRPVAVKLSVTQVLSELKNAEKDKRAILVNLVAMTTGLRIGEILALHFEDVGEEYLNIEWSYSNIDGLKSTKTDEPRTVPVLPQIRDALRRQGAQNPHGDRFIFFGENPNKPWDPYGALKVLQKMLVQLKVGDGAEAKTDEENAAYVKAVEEAKKYWKKRNIVFHSWRHFYTSRMTDKLEARKIMLATGHKTEAVFKGYADHALETDLNEVAVTTLFEKWH